MPIQPLWPALLDLCAPIDNLASSSLGRSTVTAALILVSIALAVTLALLAFGNRGAQVSPANQAKIEAETKARATAEAELDKKRKDLEEQKSQVNALKEQLKQAKRKLYEHREADRGGDELVKARLEVERTASIQLERTREELSAALSEIERLRTERELLRRKPAAAAPPPPPPPVAAATEAEAAPAPLPAEKRYRELSPAEKEKMDRIEHQASRDRARAADIDREMKRIRARLETQHRVYVVAKGELDLLRDKYKALEKRLNRTLLEKDLLKRAIGDLERKTGMAAGRTELTAQEIALADQQTEESAAREAEEKRAAEAKLLQPRKESEANTDIAGPLQVPPPSPTHS